MKCISACPINSRTDDGTMLIFSLKGKEKKKTKESRERVRGTCPLKYIAQRFGFWVQMPSLQACNFMPGQLK